jgi:hypothetical protein
MPFYYSFYNLHVNDHINEMYFFCDNMAIRIMDNEININKY